MKHGQLEKSDADKLYKMYRKIDIDGTLKIPFTIKEMVLLYCVHKWIKENVK